MLHGRQLHGTRLSTPLTCSMTPQAPAGGREFSPAVADCRFRAPLSPRLARQTFYRGIVLFYTLRENIASVKGFLIRADNFSAVPNSNRYGCSKYRYGGSIYESKKVTIQTKYRIWSVRHFFTLHGQCPETAEAVLIDRVKNPRKFAHKG